MGGEGVRAGPGRRVSCACVSNVKRPSADCKASRMGAMQHGSQGRGGTALGGIPMEAAGKRSAEPK